MTNSVVFNHRLGGPLSRRTNTARMLAAASSVTVVLAAEGYPGAPKAGGAIGNLDAANALPGVQVFHAGTSLKDGALVASGGRVLNVTAIGDTLEAAVQQAYKAVDLIDFKDGFCRRDIGWRALTR